MTTMHTKNGENTGQKLYSVDRMTWHSTPERARECYDHQQKKREELQRKAQAARSVL